MRRRAYAAWACGVVGIAAAVHLAGCVFRTPIDCENALVDCGTGGATSSSTTGTGGTGPECGGDPSEMNVTDACGVFVQADAVGGMEAEDGTQAHPYTSLQKAIDKADSKRVYACGSAPYSEAVTIAAPVEVYGGFECAKGWAWKAEGRSALKGPADAVALTLTKQGEGAKVHGFEITAPSATKKGGSSIAVAVDDIAAALISCEVTAGDGMAGEDGVTPSGTATKGTDAPPPDALKMNACINGASMALVGGAPGTLTCEDGVTAGGLGGKGGISGDGEAGADGTPADATKGKGGAGEDSMNECADGTKGKSGDGGIVGNAGILPGALSLTGLSDTNVTDGKAGSRGFGGGGGGGAKAGLGGLCLGGVDGNGASGGGGGAGGCGGKGGGGGKAGGSSIAIVSLGTKLVLTEVSLATGKGGDGGKGVVGQPGGDFGAGAKGGAGSGGVNPGCKGGDGGLGGKGGSGGGGRGGHSVGLAYVSGPSKAPALKGFAGSAVGTGGAAGPLNSMGTGAKGAAGACWDFSKNTACLQ